jgi:putative SOS response-associated peptidase YedK
MCGRFTLTLDPAQLREAFPWLFIPDDLKPRYNISPSQPVAVIPNTNENKLEYYHWGLIPSWSKNSSIGSRLINARSETLADKPAFRSSYKRRRCLILADGFYEWYLDPSGKNKTPYYITMQSRKVFGMAGLWDLWQNPEGSEIRSCTIITTSPNELIQPLHNRMPVILDPIIFTDWLASNDKEPEQLQKLLSPYPASEMTAYPVSKLVNAPENDLPECIRPLKVQ